VIYALAFAVVFVRIGLAVLQQRNVEEGRVRLIPAQSMVMQFFDCATYGLGGAAFLAGDWWQVAAMGVGAGSGSLTAMWVDRTYLRRAVPKPSASVTRLRAVK
jgi:hypothetical protein